MVQGIKNIVAVVILIGCLFVFIIQWNSIAPVLKYLASSNVTWSASGNITTTSPTSEAIAQGWPFILLAIGIGGIIALMVHASRRRGE